MGVNPEAVGVNPKAMGVDPEAVGVDPEAMGVDPEAMGVNPETPESSSRNTGSSVELRLYYKCACTVILSAMTE
ncbi:MAG: hypothetical protein LBP25_04175 [Tannerellaceae bacterium]|nr:hypothetical protein [Tannerellaceae bacterium]